MEAVPIATSVAPNSVSFPSLESFEVHTGMKPLEGSEYPDNFGHRYLLKFLLSVSVYSERTRAHS